MKSSKSSSITTVAEFLDSLPEERRAIIRKVRALVKKHIPKGYVERYAWGGITWEVPLKVCPDTYNGQPLAYVGISNQKHHVGLYLMCSYMNPKLQKTLAEGYRAAGKKLDMGKACLRFHRYEDLAIQPIAEVIAAVPMKDYIAATLKVHGKKK